MVPEPWGEDEHRGVEVLGVQRVNSSSRPEEAGRSSPLAGPWQVAAQLCGPAGLQRLHNENVWFVCQSRGGHREVVGSRGLGTQSMNLRRTPDSGPELIPSPVSLMTTLGPWPGSGSVPVYCSCSKMGSHFSTSSPGTLPYLSPAMSASYLGKYIVHFSHSPLGRSRFLHHSS